MNNFEQIDKEEFKKELEMWDKILLDVRTKQELIQFGKISENQINIDVYSQNAWEEILKLDKNIKYLVYCWHWNRSVSVRNFMQQNWFVWVKDLRWWINVWK